MSEYRAKLARIDLSTGKSSLVEVDSSLLRQYIGGVGLAARILWDETSPTTDPFSPENRLLFMIGPLTGKVPMSSRAVVCGLSPLNNAWGEATIGGSWGAEFNNTGLSGIVITILLALASGLIAGYLIRATGSKSMVYEDADEFDGAAQTEK